MLAKLRYLEMMERNPGEDGEPLQREDYLTADDFVQHLQTPTTGRRVLVSKVFLDEETTVFEVKVVSKHISDEDVYEESEVINCHVCDEVIPRGYFREHAQSAIHQNNKKMSGMFLESLINDTQPLGTNHITSIYDPYYCSSCIKLVPGDQKLAHGLSVEHRKAVDKEIALNVFVKKYVDTEPRSQQPRSASQSPLELELDDSNSRSNYLHPEIIDTGSNADDPASIGSSSNSLQLESIASHGDQPESIAVGSTLLFASTTSVHEPNKPHTSKTGVTYELGNAGVSSEIKQFKIYAKAMLEKYKIDICMWVQEDDKYLTLEAPNGNILKVTVDVFHSFRKSSSGLLCQVCNTMIAVSEKRAHMDTEKHARLISNPVDSVFRREISDRWSHDLVGNNFYYFGTERAQTNENPPPVTETTSVNQVPYIECKICNTKIHRNNHVQHVEGKKHRKNLNKIEIQTISSLQTRKEQEPVASTSRDERNGPMDVEDFMVYLKKMVSKYNLKYKLPLVKDGGLLGFEAVVTVESFHGYRQAESSVVCQVCRMNVLSKDTTAHSMTRSHVVNILQPVDDNFSRKINKSWNHCLVCNITVLNSFDHASHSPIHRNINGPGARPRDGSGDGNAEKRFCNDICG